MRKLLMIGAAVAALSAATPAVAEDAKTVFGAGAGAWTGGTIGWFLGGPVGAAIGAWTGAAVGATVLSHADLDYIRADRSIDLDLDADYDIGMVVDDDVELRAIRSNGRYGYFRSNGQIYVVDMDTRAVVEIRLG